MKNCANKTLSAKNGIICEPKEENMESEIISKMENEVKATLMEFGLINKKEDSSSNSIKFLGKKRPKT
jgi:nitrogenase subunit NifH